MIYLGIGSNLGNRRETMMEAIRLLLINGCVLHRSSGLYQTPAWGGAAQGEFLNAVLEVSFRSTAPALLDLLLEIEDQLGRVRIEKWGNRVIDLDILEFNREHWDHPRLQLPHPGYPTRSFVLQPFADLNPDFIPTGSVHSVTQLLSQLDVSELELVEDSQWIDSIE